MRSRLMNERSWSDIQVRRARSCAASWLPHWSAPLSTTEAWDAASSLSGDVLDVGCGLGGGAICWAEKFGANVTAGTNAPSHTTCRGLCRSGGVASRIQAVCCDALAVPGEG